MPEPASGPIEQCFWLEYAGRRFILSDGVTLLGRGANCHIVLDDALVSRRHAQIQTSGQSVEVQDLGSSNGVLVNGERIVGARALVAGDQVKIGQQELQVCSGPRPKRRAAASRFSARTLTGVEAAELLGARVDDFESESTQEARTLMLLGGVADKVLALGRGDEAERVLTTFLFKLLEQVQDGREPEGDTAEKSVEYAVRIAAATGKGRWVDYCFELYQALELPLPIGVVDELYTVLRKVSGIDLGALRAYVAVLHARQASFGPAERFLMQRIDGLERLASAK